MLQKLNKQWGRSLFFFMSYEVPEQWRQKKAERYVDFVFHDVSIERQISRGYQVTGGLSSRCQELFVFFFEETKSLCERSAP